MASSIDLFWANEDELWAKDGLFLADETYKLMYDCHRQVLTPQLPLSLTAVRATSPSHHTPVVVSTFTPALISLPNVRQVPSLPFESRPPGTRHVPDTSPSDNHHFSASPSVDSSFFPPALDPLPYSGSSLPSSAP